MSLGLLVGLGSIVVVVAGVVIMLLVIRSALRPVAPLSTEICRGCDVELPLKSPYLPGPPDASDRPRREWRREHLGDYFDPPAAAIQRMDGTPLASRKAWGQIPYEELGPMFLDQFLLRYFTGVITLPVRDACTSSPWHDFCQWNPWGSEMPLLFEQLTGYKLDDMQLNNAIAEFVRRSEISQRAAAPEPGRKTDPAGYTGL
jgi:hypothetical protein